MSAAADEVDASKSAPVVVVVLVGASRFAQAASRSRQIASARMVVSFAATAVQRTCLAAFELVLAKLQAGLYVTTGLWPLVHIRSFEAVTGPKRERWLVKTMGLLIAAVGVALGTSRDVRVLGAASALALGACDVVYVAKRRISPVYLLDAVIEGAIAIGWLRHARQAACAGVCRDNERNSVK